MKEFEFKVGTTKIVIKTSLLYEAIEKAQKYCKAKNLGKPELITASRSARWKFNRMTGVPVKRVVRKVKEITDERREELMSQLDHRADYLRNVRWSN